MMNVNSATCAGIASVQIASHIILVKNALKLGHTSIATAAHALMDGDGPTALKNACSVTSPAIPASVPMPAIAPVAGRSTS